MRSRISNFSRRHLFPKPQKQKFSTYQRINVSTHQRDNIVLEVAHARKYSDFQDSTSKDFQFINVPTGCQCIPIQNIDVAHVRKYLDSSDSTSTFES